VRGDANYVGKQWDTVANIAYIKPTVRVNARIGAERNDLKLELFVKNVFNNKNWVNGTRATSLAEPGTLIFVNSFFTTAQGLLLTAPDKREIGLRASVKF
jgi:iron complex outermembrane receptor protein